MKKMLFAMFAIALFTLSACEKPNHSTETEVPTIVKRVKTFSLVGDGWADVYQYSYDNQGRVSKIFREEAKQWTFTYEGNKVIVKKVDGVIAFDMTLGANGFCETMKDEWGDVRTYTYNAEGRMTKCMKGDKVASDITLEDGCITTWTRWKDGQEQFKIHNYSNVKNVGGIHNIYSEATGVDRWMYETGLFGKGTAYLCGGNQWKHSTDASTITYEYDEEGFVIAEHKDYPGWPENFEYSWEVVK